MELGVLITGGEQPVLVERLFQQLVGEGLLEAVKAGVSVVLSSRALRGPVVPASDALRDGFLVASDLGPAKTRILLMLALAIPNRTVTLQDVLDGY